MNMMTGADDTNYNLVTMAGISSDEESFEFIEPDTLETYVTHNKLSDNGSVTKLGTCQLDSNPNVSYQTVTNNDSIQLSEESIVGLADNNKDTSVVKAKNVQQGMIENVEQETNIQDFCQFNHFTLNQTFSSNYTTANENYSKDLNYIPDLSRNLCKTEEKKLSIKISKISDLNQIGNQSERLKDDQSSQFADDNFQTSDTFSPNGDNSQKHTEDMYSGKGDNFPITNTQIHAEDMCNTKGDNFPITNTQTHAKDMCNTKGGNFPITNCAKGGNFPITISAKGGTCDYTMIKTHTEDLCDEFSKVNICASRIESNVVQSKKGLNPSFYLDCGQSLLEDGKLLHGQFSPSFRREKPLCADDFKKMFDEDGRLVDEHALRKAVFMGGVDPSIRKDVWLFLFGFFKCSSTAREREDLLIDYIMKYHEQKSRWKTMLMVNAKPGASLLEQGLVARYQIDTTNSSLRSPDCNINDPISEFEIMQNNIMGGKAKTGDLDFPALSKSFQSLDISSPELKQKIDFMKIQAQVHVNRQNVNVQNLWNQLRVIDKDVPRTDRDQEYFKGPLNPNLTVLREILVTFAAFYPKIGYAQGMNDILARFLVVFDSEVETYWCFSSYMSKIQQDFTEDGMVRKIELVVELLEEMDVDLLQHLREHDLGDLMFCHRWLLLGFKREMSFSDSLRCFEILSSHHLELSSLEAENARRKQTMREFENLGGITRTARLDTECEYTFELFVCLALLEECRNDLLNSTDTAEVFTVINSVKIDLDDILCKSAGLFYKYCKKSVDDSFLMVEMPASPRRRHKSIFK